MEKVQPKASGPIKFIKPASLNKGDTIVGTYEGQMPEDQFGKENFKIRQEDGSLTVLNQSYILTTLLENVEKGTQVKIVYGGKTKGNKGQDLHNFDVYQDRSSAASKAGPTTSAPKKSALPF